MSDISTVSKYFATVNEGFTATTTAAITANALTVPISSVSGLADGSIFVGIINPADITKKQVFTGTVDVAGSRVTGCIWTRGISLAGHPVGTTVVDYTTGTAFNMLSKGILKEHNQNGTHSAINATSVSTPTLTVSSTLNIPDGTITPADLEIGAGVSWASVDYSTTATVTGWGSTTNKQIRYIKTGKLVTMFINIDGTSNNVNTQVSLPFAPRTTIKYYEDMYGLGINNGAVLPGPRYSIDNATSTATFVTFFTEAGGGLWTASGPKQVRAIVQYEAA